MGDFGEQTAVEGGDGRFTARLSPDWEIWGPNGGYVAAIALRAAGAGTPLRRPASFSAHFLSVAEFGQVELSVTTLRAARRAASLRVAMTQQERPILEALVWVVDDALAGLAHDDTAKPDVPAPDRLRSIEELVPEADRRQRFKFWDNLEVRPTTAWIPWPDRRPGPPRWCEWYRLRPRATFDDPFTDAARALLLIDTMTWPAACQPHLPDSGYVAPSLDVSVRFHAAAPAAEWLLCEAAAPIARHGLIGGAAHVWSPDGALLASGGGQLLCRPAPRP
ncbi:MAG: thioesterase family protein [Deltaproteobacteria bacterium]|nr:thioesterase family protein [Deltaproteobacteria bacterium]